MSSPRVIGTRYEIRDIVGRGGMGVVYRAYDKVVGREVALKTLGDIQGRSALELFYREWRLLANLRHPNIVDIFDIGEFEDEGTQKPFFVMPLLPGTTLDHLLRLPGQPITLERLVEIISQTCRGLQAIHDSGLVHRDIKPSNIFVMEFNSVKLIDFGVVHLVGGNTATGIKGTVSYMSPEQIQSQECTPASDIFSLGVVCYEALCGVKPFTGHKVEEIFHAILHSIPAPISEVNPTVSQMVSRAVHKALAKQPRHRYTSALEFADTLQRALRGEIIPALDPGKIQPRIQRAIRAFEQGRYDMATDILSDLEAAGHIDPALTPLRSQIDQALRRQKIRDLLDRAELGLAEDELTLALQNAEAALTVAPDSEEALKLRDNIRSEISRREVTDWLAAAGRAIDHYEFGRARQLLLRVAEIDPDSAEGAALLQQLESREHAYRTLREEKEALYRGAKEAWQAQEFSTAVDKLQRVLALESQAPDTSSADSRANYSNFLNLAESARAAIEGLRDYVAKCIANRDYERAIDACADLTSRYSGHPLPQGLRMLAESCQKRDTVARMAAIADQVNAEPDLDRKLELLRPALDQFPNYPVFEQWARSLRDRLALAKSVVAKARAHEEHGRFQECLEQWGNLSAIYPEYAGLQKEINRIAALAGTPNLAGEYEKRAEQAREASTTSAPPNNPPPPSPPSSPSIVVPPVQSFRASAPSSATMLSRQPPPPPQVVQPPKPAAVIPPRPAVVVEKPAPGKPAMESVNEALVRFAESMKKFWAAAGAQFQALISKVQAALPTSVAGRKSATWIVVGTAAACLILIGAAMVVTRTHDNEKARKGPGPVTPSKARVVLKSPNRGAIIRLNDVQATADNFDLEIAPGTYNLEISGDGYESHKETITVPPEGLNRTLPALHALPALVRITTDLQKSIIKLDERPPVTITEPEFSFSDVTPQEHTLVVSDGTNEARINFSTTDVAQPRLNGTVQAKGLQALAVASFSNSVQVVSMGNAEIEAVLDNRAPDEKQEGSATFRNVKRSIHELLVNPGKKEERRFAIDASPRPTLWLGVYSDRNIGTLMVTAGIEQFTVTVDGYPVRRKVRDGSMFIPNLAPKAYKVKVVADGYDGSPEQEVTVTKGSLVRHQVTLNKVSQFATLNIRGVPPRTPVLVDNAQVGVTDADGSLVLDKLEPLEHTIQLKHGLQMKSAPVKRTLSAREPVTLNAADFHVERVPAIIAVSTVPDGARLEWTCAGKAPQQGTAPMSINCDGQVVVHATAPGYAEEIKTENPPQGGLTYPMQFTLKRVDTPTTPVAAKSSCSPADLPKSGWSKDGEWYTSGRGAALPCANATGIYTFTIQTPRGFGPFAKSLNWSLTGAARTDFVLEKKSLSIRGQAKKNVEPYDQDGQMSFRLAVDSAQTLVSVRSGESWQALGPISGDFRKVRVEFAHDVKIKNFNFQER